RREVVRVITPGMVVDPEALNPKRDHYLAAVVERSGTFGLSALDLSTGRFVVKEVVGDDAVLEELWRLDPAELLLDEAEPERPWSDPDRLPGASWTVNTVVMPGPARANRELREFFELAALDGFGLGGYEAGLCAAAAILQYVLERQKVKPRHVYRLTPQSDESVLIIDDATRRNLELTRSMTDGRRQGSLLHVLDATVTAMGGRLLRQWLLYPPREMDLITARHGAVDDFLAGDEFRVELRSRLGRVADLERLGSRAVLGQLGPREAAALRQSLQALPELCDLMTRAQAPLLVETVTGLDRLEDLAAELMRGLVDEAPAGLGEGGVIRPGYDPSLDELVAAATEGKQWIAALEETERRRTGIPGLKVGYNRVFGYFLEISRSKSDLVPENYVRKQTLVGAERYITPELKEVEDKVLGAEERRIELEAELFGRLRDQVAAAATRLADTAHRLARLDVLSGLAHTAREHDYVRPKMHQGDELTLRAARHPMVEFFVPAGEFVPNDVHLDHQRQQIIILTGPNMAGKSTILRQTALIVIMAHAGSFVPAEAALVPITDRVFTRVGAADDLTRGRSTFMVEMCETANILHNATARSLVILDEVGRGTSTFDGLSIAWAVVEYLHALDGVGVKTLFATHYHELTELAGLLTRVKNFTIAVKELGEDILFLRQMVKGGVSRSYGIQVARLAGLPNAVLDRAREVLGALEAEDGDRPRRLAGLGGRGEPSGEAQIPLFAVRPHPVVEQLSRLDPDRLTPLEALQILSRLKREV
ncbi:MAG: DNA mismatch repair protein MutS, partial [Proteobacteria bacterium]|nr:DNA mismatch repair protein MutS [Pseudomonadota bacterium]